MADGRWQTNCTLTDYDKVGLSLCCWRLIFVLNLEKADDTAATCTNNNNQSVNRSIKQANKTIDGHEAEAEASFFLFLCYCYCTIFPRRRLLRKSMSNEIHIEKNRLVMTTKNRFASCVLAHDVIHYNILN